MQQSQSRFAGWQTLVQMLLSRWSLVTALMVLLSVVAYVGMGFSPTDSALGQEFSELMLAVRSPFLYRLQTLTEAFYWLLIGGVFIILAGLFIRRAPVQAIIVAVCGIGQSAGALGSFLREHGIGDLAACFAIAAPNQKPALLQSAHDLNRVIEPHYILSTLLLGVGFLLAACIAWKVEGFPRWLAIWLGIAGLLGLCLFALRVIGSLSALLLPIILLDVIVLIGLFVAMTVVFRRTKPSRGGEASGFKSLIERGKIQ